MFERFMHKTGVEQLMDKIESEEPEEVFSKEPAYRTSLERKQDILDFLKTRKGLVTREAEIAEAVGITEGYVNRLISELLSKRTLTRTGKRTQYKYKVNRQSVRRGRPTKTKVEEQPQTLQQATKVEHKVHETVAALTSLEELVLEYVKDTRCTDVLHFLSWVEQREVDKITE